MSNRSSAVVDRSPHGPVAFDLASDFVRGAREDRVVTVAMCEPVTAMSSCLDDLRSTLGGLPPSSAGQADSGGELACVGAGSAAVFGQFQRGGAGEGVVSDGFGGLA